MPPDPCVVVAHPYPDLYGSDRVLLESVTALGSVGYRVVVVMPLEGRLADEVRSLGHHVRIVAFPVLRKALLRPAGLVQLAGQVLTSLPRLVRLLRAEGADALYVNTITEPVWLLAAQLARVPALCHVHEAEDRLPLPHRLALYLPLLLARVVVVNSRASGRTAAHAVPALQRRSRLVYNGLHRVRPVLPPRSGPLDLPRLVVVGRLSPRKGQHLAVEAVRLLAAQGRPVQLTLVGDVFPGYESYSEGLRQTVTRHGLTDAVRFAGFQEDVWPFYDDADVVVVPSFTESFGNVAVEGMLSERPVVATRAAGLTEILDGERTGLLVPVDDAPALAEAVAGLLADPERRTAVAAAGRASAVERFGLPAYAAGIVAILAEFTAGH